MTPIEHLEIHNGRIEGNRIIEIRGIPSGRRTVEAILGRKWARVRMVGRKTFKKVLRSTLDRVTVGSVIERNEP